MMRSKFALVTYLLILVNIGVFLLRFQDPAHYNYLIETYGLKPVEIMEGTKLYTLVTSMFLHADLLHLGMNMFFLLMSGDGCERAMGNLRFFAFYLVCGVLAGVFHAYFNSSSDLPTIGASGAIFGVLAGYAVLFPYRWMISLFGFIPIPLPAIIFVFITILIETAYVSSGVVENIAHIAHLGGFLAGVFLALIIGPSKQELENTKTQKNTRAHSAN